MSELLHLNGYGMYVWPCYLVFFGLVAWHTATPRFTRKQILKKVATRQRREALKKETSA